MGVRQPTEEDKRVVPQVRYTRYPSGGQDGPAPVFSCAWDFTVGEIVWFRRHRQLRDPQQGLIVGFDGAYIEPVGLWVQRYRVRPRLVNGDFMERSVFVYPVEIQRGFEEKEVLGL